MLVWVPNIVVVRTGSELMMSPFKLHVIDKGLSPLLIAHISCADSPWLTGWSPKEKGTICGGSVNKIVSVPFCLITIDFKFCRMGCDSCGVFSSAGVCATVLIVHRGNHQKAGLLANHSCCQGGVRVNNVPLETPGNRQRSIS